MSQKAVFLDRDGVINIDNGYVYKIEEFHFTNRIFDIIRHFDLNDYLVFIITNQSGIGRGYFSEEDFKKLNDWMVLQFKRNGINIKKVYYCPFHPTKGIGKYRYDSFDRKPNPGMILKAKEEFNIDLTNSILIGDKESDIIAGIRAGIGKKILINNTNYHDSKADLVITNINEILMYNL